MVHTSCSGLFERCSAYVQRKFKPAVGFGTCAVTVAAGTGALAKDISTCSRCCDSWALWCIIHNTRTIQICTLPTASTARSIGHESGEPLFSFQQLQYQTFKTKFKSLGYNAFNQFKLLGWHIFGTSWNCGRQACRRRMRQYRSPLVICMYCGS